MNKRGPDAHSQVPGHVPEWIAVAIAVGCGALMALQARVNGQLADRIDDPFTAAAISFGSGLVLVLVLLAALPAGRGGVRRLLVLVRSGQVAWWYLLGGLGGAIMVLSQGLVAAGTGVALFTIALVAGQTVSGIAVDRVGLSPSGHKPLTLRRAVGAALTIVALLWSAAAHAGGEIPLWMLALPFLSGLAIAWQQAVNGRVAVASGSVLTSTGVSFVSGTVVLVVIALAQGVVAGFPAVYPAEAWLYSGGLIGVTFIFGLAFAVRHTGVLLLGLGTVAGQVTAALALDLVSPTRGHAVDWVTVSAALLAGVAVVIASSVGSRRRVPGVSDRPLLPNGGERHLRTPGAES